MGASPGYIPLIIIPAGVAASYLVQRARSSRYDYRCGNCGQTFALAPLAGALAPHRFGGQKWFRCPHCGRFSWVTPVPRQ